MKKLILHVGFHKTGSSAIQASLANGILEGSNYIYHGFGEQNGSVGLYTLFADDKKIHQQHKQMGLTSADVAKYKKEIRTQLEFLLSRTEQDVIVSGEDCSLLSQDELSEIPSFFKQFSFDVDVVIYVRPWHNLLESVWCELLKHRQLHIDLNFNAELKKNQLDLKTKISKFDSVFGKEHVHVYSYQKNNFPNGCVVTDFCRKLNIELDPTRIVHANIGFSLPTAQLFYIYRKYGPPRGYSPIEYKRNQALIYHLSLIKGPSVYFHSDLTREVLAPFRLEKAWIEERLQGPFQEVFHDDYPHVIRDEADLLNLSENAINWLCDKCGLEKLQLISNAYSPTEIAHQIFLFQSKQYRVKKKSWIKRVKKKISNIFKGLY